MAQSADNTNKTDNKMTPSQAGQKGGRTTSRKHGPAFYAEIGKRGGQVTSRDRQHMSKIGQKGGKARNRSS